MRPRTYLDANAGLPLLPEAREALLEALGCANPSSVHAEGRAARQFVEAARAEVGAAVGAKPDHVIFTSGATEAAALALASRVSSGKSTIHAGQLYVGATEHPCVLAGGRFAADTVTRLPVDRNGVLNLEALEQVLQQHDHTAGPPYVALMLANNETGVIHPVAQAAQVAKAFDALVFCDAVQALGRIPVDIAALGVDFLAISGHKIGGPQGSGALVLADDTVRPEPLLTGGGQERRRRSGTENVPAITGFGVAARLARHHLQAVDGVGQVRDALERGILAVAPDARVFGAGAERLPNTTMFAAPGIPAEIAVIAFDLEGIAVSAGSACSSGKVSASHVLEAMGEPPEVARGGVRVSLTPQARMGDVEQFIEAWRAIHSRMGRSRAA